MDLFGNLNLRNPLQTITKTEKIVGELGIKPHIGERIYKYRRRLYNVEKELSDEDLNLLNKNKNIKISSVGFGRTKQLSKFVTKGHAHIIFYYRGKQKSIKSILKQIPGTILVEESFDKYGKFYTIEGRAGSRTWWHNAALTISKII